jgi:multimeric flavodoxin WrbA
MKIVGFVGSPRKGGNTETCVDEILKGAAEKGAETKLYNIAHMNIKPCQGCMACMAKGNCIVDDDFQQVVKEINSSDAIVIGSPVYMGQMSAQTKAMFDRLCSYINPDFTMRLKKGTGLVLAFTQNQPDLTFCKAYVDMTGEMFKFLGFSLVEKVIIGGTRMPDDLKKKPEELKMAREAGKKLAESMVVA